MTKYYQISVSQLVDTFSRIESGTAFDFIINTSETVLSDLAIAQGDVLIASVNNNVYYKFDVVGKTTNELQLKKSFEIQKTISHSINAVGVFEEISESQYNSICSQLFLGFNQKSTIQVNNVNIDNVKEKFADWLFKQGKYVRVYKGERSVLIEKLTEFETAYENDFGISIFNFSNNSIELVINELETNNIEYYGEIGAINKRTVGNGSVKAILGPNNYIKFLKEILKEQKAIQNVINLLTEQEVFKISSFQSKVNEAGLIFSPQLIKRFIASLCTKPFVICTGLSGSGKTKLAQAFVQWITANESQYVIVPVGADWTNREPLLGYPNALKPDDYIKPDNGALDVIIQANKHPELPYFLILDEMNLSHVERYFADFLSVMESKGEILLFAEGTVNNGVPAKLALPSNLFIIGTVNIDETTYMFSPKVLDRANVIEFRVTKNEIENFFASQKDIDMNKLKTQGASMGQSFMKMAERRAFEEQNLKDTHKTLVNFFEQLKKTGAEFGYRSASEIIRLINQLTIVDAGFDADEKLDIAIMQKLLPKLHGSRRKLCPMLITLGGFCVDKEKIENIEKDVFSKEDFDFKTDGVIYPISLEKITRMYKGAIENGFASYAEA